LELWLNLVAYGGPLLAEDTTTGGKRALAPVGWHQYAVIVPGPTLDVVSSVPTITTSATTITIRGANFATDSQVVFDAIGPSQPTCTVKSATQNEVVCSLSQLAPGTLSARVLANSGFSEPRAVATIVPDDSLKIGLGVGIPVGIVVVAAIIALIVLITKIVARRRLRSMFNKKATDFRDAVSSAEMAEIYALEQKAKQALAKWEVPYADIKFGKEVGKGSFGRVFLGRWNGKKVAIKEAQLQDPHAREEFFREAFLMLGMPPHVRCARPVAFSRRFFSISDQKFDERCSPTLYKYLVLG
jgi:hypothetical protein